MLISTEIFSRPYKFHTDTRIFSPRAIDAGTLSMLNLAYADGISAEEKVLDLGCGYGVVGIALAGIIPAKNVFMSDFDAIAVELAAKNAVLNGVEDVNIIQSDAFSNINEKDFTLILSNPPYHSDFSVPKAFVEKGFNRLAIGGRMYMVTKRLAWYKNKLASIFGGVRVTAHDGYYVFMSEKRQPGYANKNNSFVANK